MNPMNYSMRPAVHRHHVNTCRDTRTPQEKQQELSEIREKLNRMFKDSLEKARDINKQQQRVDCPVCHGTGNIRMWAGLAGDTVITDCTECNGEGRVAA